MSKVVGHVREIRGLIARVAFLGDKPGLHELLSITGSPEALLEVQSFTKHSEAVCINLTNSPEVTRGAEVHGTGRQVSVPVGEQTKGRLFNALGQPIDGGADLDGLPRREIHAEQPPATYRKPTTELVETGIKVIDFFAPFVKGRKIGIMGGAGVGKTILTMELIHNVAEQAESLAFFIGIGERIREGHELYHTLKQSKLLDNTVMFFGQMNENPAMRSTVGLAAATLAEYFRDEKSRDVLVFIDNIYRHVQAGTELATTIGETPSEGGYQPDLFSGLNRFEDRLYSNENGAITSVQTVYIPADDLSDPAVQEVSQQLDSVVVLSRALAEAGIRPSVDIVQTTSSLLTPEIVGRKHYELALQVQSLIAKYNSLRNIVAIVGENELSVADLSDYQKAKELIQYFTQPLFVTETLVGKPGERYSREQTIAGVTEILDKGN